MQHICANTKYEIYANVCVPVFRHFLHSKYIDIEANTQIHKYRNTVLVKVADWPNMCYIFETVMIQGPQEQCSQMSDVQIHKYRFGQSCGLTQHVLHF